MPLLDECLRNGKQLISQKDVTDTHVVRDRMKALENQWRDFNTSLEEKQKLSRHRADQLNQYETLRVQVGVISLFYTLIQKFIYYQLVNLSHLSLCE